MGGVAEGETAVSLKLPYLPDHDLSNKLPVENKRPPKDMAEVSN